MSFKKQLLKPTSFKTSTKRSLSSELKLLLLKCSTEASRGYGADEFEAVCKEFLAQYKVEPKQVVAKTTKADKKPVEKPVDTPVVKADVDDLLA